jgi:hypothetical protein
VKEILQGDGEAAALETAVTNLQNVLNEAGAAMYQQQGQPSTDGPSANGGPESDTEGDEDVIEGEFSDA